LASQLNPNFRSDPKWAGLFKITLTGDDDIPINKRGSGIRRLILFSFFRAEAERLSEVNNKGNIIYAIEEPETAQHPDNQCKIIESLQKISEADGCQILLTTHVPALASLLPIESVRYISLDEKNGRHIQFGDDKVYENIVSVLGILPDKRAKVIVCLEGPHDINFLKRINSIISNSEKEIINIFNDPRIAFVVLGGSTLKEWVNSNYLKNLNLPEVHIYDRDMPTNGIFKYQDAVDTVNKRGNGSKAYLTNKREMENYLHIDAINAVFKDVISSKFDFCLNDNCDVETEIKNALGQSKINRRSIKHWLNEDAADNMTVKYLQERGGYDEIKGWFIEINKIIK
jgi:Predicted ATP-dependent endonuclease of the OLD family